MPPVTIGVDQHELLCWVLARLDAPAGAAAAMSADPPGLLGLPFERFRAAGFTSGLTALVGLLAEHDAVGLPATWAPYVAEQRCEVAARWDRFAAVLPEALAALADAGVDALPVKGAIVAASAWPSPMVRPMADLDLLVPPASRDRAAAALSARGFREVERSAWEDVFLAWGDGRVGRTDGESADHNGKIELHPGWVERFHHYLVDDGGALWRQTTAGSLLGIPCRRLPPFAVAGHVLGHLSAAVVRAEVRPLHVVDAVAVLTRLDADGRRRLAAFQGGLDPRLVAPALWLVGTHRPDVVGPSDVADALARLPPRAAAVLGVATPAAVLRDPSRRSELAWRLAFATSMGERARVARQALLPPASDLRGGGPTGDRGRFRGAALQAARARRGVERLLGARRARS